MTLMDYREDFLKINGRKRKKKTRVLPDTEAATINKQQFFKSKTSTKCVHSYVI